MSKLKITRETETTLLATRHFDAPPQKLFEAHVNPELIRKWMLGPDGWVMSTCEVDPKPGGKIHYVWRKKADGSEFSLTGEFVAIEAPYRIEHIERMHLPDTTPDNRVETRFEKDGTGTQMTMRMTLPDTAALEAMLATGMAEGMEESYSRLDAIE